MRRAEFNKAVLALAASVLFDPDRVTSAHTVDAALLEDLRSITADLTRRHHHAHPQTVLGPARAHLRYLLDLQATTAATIPAHLRPGLDWLTAKTAAIVGWVVFRSQADLVTAHAPDVTAGAEPAARRRPRGRHRRTGSPRLAGRTHRRRAGAVRGPAHGASSARSRRGHPAELPSGRPGTAVLLLGRHPLPGVRGQDAAAAPRPSRDQPPGGRLAATQAPHPRLGVLVDLAIARTHDGHADNAVDLLVEAGRLALARGIDGFARWRLREGRLALPTTQRRAFDERLSALA